jgi:restriction endonuclease S subunit
MKNEEWREIKLKYLVELRNEKVKNEELNKYNLKIALENIESYTGRLININSDTSFEGEGRFFYPNDVLFNKLRPYLSKFYIADKKGICFGELLIFIPNTKLLIPRFLYFLISSYKFIHHVDGSTYGSKMPRASWDSFISNYSFFIPSLFIQKNIANFLDRKTAQIDSLLSKKTKLISLLQEEEKAFINEKLTDKNGSWEKKKLKYVAKVQTGGTPKIQGANFDCFENGTVNWFTPADFKEGGILDNSKRKINQKAIEQVEIFPENSVYLVSIGATLGKVGISLKKGSANQQINIITFNESKVYSQFGYYLFKSNTEYIINEADHTTLAILNQSKTKELEFPIPSLSIQKNLVEEIESHINQSRATVHKLEQEVALLKEYRQSLISEVVLGVKNVE